MSTFEDHYYGPSDKLLNYCFGNDFNFYVARQVRQANDKQDSTDSLIPLFVVFNRNDKPVLLLEIRDDGWAEKAELRYLADKRMGDLSALMLDDCPIPRLWGLSVLGTSMRVYYGDTATHDVVPHPIGRSDPSPDLLPDFLAEEWAWMFSLKTG
ncbi:hypothetical protein FS837_005424 [Tulasnella sp. UAMH 9824]|nr:hypothetical protein FS837_005424 [Tulasnella sp. UAMH 9824]